MGALREKAEAEVEERKAKAQARRESDAEYKRRRHEEEAKPTAEFLTSWSGVTVKPEELERDDGLFPGFHSYLTWKVAIDGFDLVVRQEKRQKAMLEEHTPDYAFELYQRVSDGDVRRITDPADLLDAVAVAAEPVA